MQTLDKHNFADFCQLLETKARSTSKTFKRVMVEKKDLTMRIVFNNALSILAIGLMSHILFGMQYTQVPMDQIDHAEHDDATMTQPSTALLQVKLDPAYRDNMITWHAIFMSIAYMICIPGAIASSRYFRRALPGGKLTWFRAHIALNVCGILCVILGCIFIACRKEIPGGVPHKSAGVKKAFGIIVAIMTFLMFLTAAFRPKESRPQLRKIWWYTHSILGMSAQILGLVTICIGMALVGVYEF